MTGLLRVFKNYYPEIIVGDITKGRASSFKVCFHGINHPIIPHPKLTLSSTLILSGEKSWMRSNSGNPKVKMVRARETGLRSAIRLADR